MISDWVAKYTKFIGCIGSFCRINEYLILSYDTHESTTTPPPPINIKPDLGFPRE